MSTSGHRSSGWTWKRHIRGVVWLLPTKFQEIQCAFENDIYVVFPYWFVELGKAVPQVKCHFLTVTTMLAVGFPSLPIFFEVILVCVLNEPTVVYFKSAITWPLENSFHFSFHKVNWLNTWSSLSQSILGLMMWNAGESIWFWFAWVPCVSFSWFHLLSIVSELC